MSATTTSLRALFTRLSLSPSPLAISSTRRQTCLSTTTTTTTTTPRSHVLPTTTAAARMMHATPAQHAKDGGKQQSKRGRKKKGAVEPDQRIINLKASMPRHVPAPLRFARNRYLRHWTIHRAWLLFQRRERERREKELTRMYQSMHGACEELRKTSGPGTHDEGYLYRVAMEKKGLYGHRGIPIEYARAQTETPAREPWNHGWTR